MRSLAWAAAAVSALAACTMEPRPLVPDTPEGPASYICYSPVATTPEEVRALAERQCRHFGLMVTGLLGQEWVPFRCGALTPSVAAFRCGK
jgi:hypothetical protein